MGNLENIKAETAELSEEIQRAVVEGKWTRAKGLAQQLVARLFVLEELGRQKAMSYCICVQRGENIWELTVCGRFTGIRVDTEARAKGLADQAEKVVSVSGLPDLRIATEALIAAHCRGRAVAQAMLDNTRPRTSS